MGSRRGRHAALIAALFGCTKQPTTKAPAQASDHWAFALVAPEEEGLLIASVYVNGHGPLPFVIDLDARHSAIDETLAKALSAEAGIPKTKDDALGLPHVVQATTVVDGPTVVDGLGQQHRTRQIDVREVRLGDFVVKDRTVRVVRDGAFDADGRRIWGKVGRDVLDDKLAFGFDRELGVGMLARHHAAQDAATVVATISQYDHDDVPLARHLVNARINGLEVKLALDLAATTSSLRATLWPSAKLAAVPLTTRQVDELGDERMRASAALASRIDARTLHATAVLLTDYDDHRWREQDLDGTLGLDAFRDASAWVDANGHSLSVTPRSDKAATLVARLGRWGDGRLATCPHPGCVTLTLLQTQGDGDAERRKQIEANMTVKPDDAPPPAVKHGAIRIARETPGIDLDITFAAVAVDGTRQLYAATLTAAAMTIDGELDAASVELLDVGLLPRACPNHLACIHPITPAR